MGTNTVRSTIQLSFGDESQIVVTPEDQDRFAISVNDAIDACRAHAKEREFQTQHSLLMTLLKEWLNGKLSRVDRAFLTARDGGLLFLVVQKEQQLDEDLQDALTDLDIRIARDPALDLIKLSVLAIPKSSSSNIESFIL